jgi:diguanylate cyclase (GGDEF)-like protein
MKEYAGRRYGRNWPAARTIQIRGAMSSGILSRSESPQDVAPDAKLEMLQANLHRLERRDWWLWIAAMCVMLLLTSAVFSMNFPGLIEPSDSIFQQSLDQSVRGLAGLVLLFNLYSIYQQVTIKRTRKQLSDQLAATKQLYKEATTDPLTSLANRRTAEEYLHREMSRSRRRKSPLTVVAFDLNNFKKINDRYGHSAGDMILCAFAQKLMYRRRGEDMAVRMGGDEFLLLLPECPPEQVPMLLERLRPCEVNFQGKRLPVEFSSGVATYDGAETEAQFLERADQALYADKRARKAVRVLEPVVA